MVRLSSTLRVIVGTVIATIVLSTPALAHAGALRLTQGPVSVPRWLLVSTGGGVIGMSFLFASLVTDHAMIQEINDQRFTVPSRDAVHTAVKRAVQALSVVVLGVVVLSGLFGPQAPTVNFAILVVWVGWWAGYTMSVYLIGNTWPAINPWRTLATLFPRVSNRTYPDRFGSWPSVFGLLGLVWVEVISPVARVPELLAALILGYSVITIAGAIVYGVDTWFARVDPIARVFRCYGRVAPFQRTERGIDLTLPGTSLTRSQETTAGSADNSIFIVALLWVTTYDGLIATPLWTGIIRAIVGIGVPPLVVYAVTMLAGFGVFLAIYRVAARLVRRTGETYIAPHTIAERFAPALLPIAAGYHLAHFLGYFLSLSPSLAAVLTHPFSAPANPLVIVLPEWFGSLQLLFVLFGHLLAIWVAHAISFGLFTGRLQPIRSQYPLIVVMILYTVTSMWIVVQPYSPPPFV